MAHYYTRTGDAGETLYTGERVPKDSLRVEAYGTLDELQAQLGFARALADDGEVDADIEALERKLVDCMAQLASTGGPLRVSAEDVASIEKLTDKYSERIDEHGFHFVVPGTSAVSAAFHVARTVARRAERRVLTYAAQDEVDAELLKFLNRISDLLFAVAVYVDL